MENNRSHQNQVEPVAGIEGGALPPNIYYQQVDMTTNQTQPNQYGFEGGYIMQPPMQGFAPI